MRETEILVEQQTPQGVLVCDHAGGVINKLSLDGMKWPCLRINENPLSPLKDLRTSSGVRLCWELEEPKGTKND